MRDIPIINIVYFKKLCGVRLDFFNVGIMTWSQAGSSQNIRKFFNSMDMRLCKSKESYFREICRNYYRHPFRQHQHKTAARLAGNGPCCDYVMRVEPACSQKKLKARHGASVRECRDPHIWRFGTRWSHDSSKILNPWYFTAWKNLNPWFWMEKRKEESNA